jgi:5-formyltetrahydrofolate cyclo-ligase
MPVSIDQQRQDALRARRSLSDEVRAAASQVICGRVVTSREFRAARSIGCFLPMHDEVDTREIIDRAWRANKRVFVPVLRRGAGMMFCEIRRDTELQRDRFGIYEPVRGVLADPRTLETIVTPLVAFDADNNRIGMGSGYYDRCFAFLRHRHTWLRPKLIGVAFQCQQVEKIFPNPWDIRLYRVVTEQQ